MSIFGIFNTGTLVLRLVQGENVRQFLARRASLILASLVIYGLEGYAAGQLIADGNATQYVYMMGIMLITIYGVALSRAWELLGARSNSFSTIIDSIRGLQDKPPAESE
jgi:hypothetical protein